MTQQPERDHSAPFVNLLFVAAGLCAVVGAISGGLQGGFIGLALGAIGFSVYCIPAIVAMNRKHHNSTAILVANLLLGWAVLPWVFCLIWAFSSNPPPPAAPTPARTPSAPPQATKACPMCAEQVLAAAIKCKHCGSDITPT